MTDEDELAALQPKFDAITTFAGRVNAGETLTPDDLEEMYQLGRELKINAATMSNPEDRREVDDVAESCRRALDSMNWNMIWPDDF